MRTVRPMFFLGLLLVTSLCAQEESKKESGVVAPAFDGVILGMAVQAGRLGVVLDVSKSMNRELPPIQAELRKKLPRTPVLHVDGCGLAKPDPRSRVVNGVAPETVTAVAMLGEHAGVDAVLWISDMGDPPNSKGVEAMAGILAEHQIRLFLLSVTKRPGPSLRKLVEECEGEWKLVPVEGR